jgi:hypothetical protein
MEGLIVLLVYGGIGILVFALGTLFYLRSVSSRKRYCCPQCGEQMSVELMKAEHCNMCGAPLKAEMIGE